MIKTKFVFAVSLVAILAVSSSMAASVTDVAPATGEGQAISGTTGTVGDVYDWSKWSGYATEGIASVNYVNNAVDAAGNAAQWAENHAAAAGTAAEEANEAAATAKSWAQEAKNTLVDKQDKSTAVKVTTSGTAVGSATVPVYVNSSGVATPITSYSGNAASATKATQDGNGKVIADTYATKTELAKKQDPLKAGTNITIASDGTISATDTVYTLPAATENTLGGVKLYTNLGTNQDGTVTQNVVNNLSKDVDSISAKYDTLNGVQTGITSRLEEVEQDITDLVDDKVDVAQGSTNANKIMITNASGGVAPVAITNSGNGSLVTGVSIADGKLTVTKAYSLPTVNNATLTIQKNGTTVGTFTANSSANKTIDITVPTGALASKSTITNADVADNAAIAQSKISGLTDALGGKQATLTTTNVVSSGTGDVVTAVTAANGTVTVTKGKTLGGLATKSAVGSSEITDGAVALADLASNSVNSAKIVDASIATADIADGAVTSAKIVDGTVATADIADGAVTTAKIAASAVTSAKIADGAVATADIAAGAVTAAKTSGVIGSIPSGSATSTTYATIWVE